MLITLCARLHSDKFNKKISPISLTNHLSRTHSHTQQNRKQHFINSLTVYVNQFISKDAPTFATISFLLLSLLLVTPYYIHTAQNQHAVMRYERHY